MALQAGFGRITRGGTCGVASRRKCDLGHTESHGARDGCGHAAGFETARGIERFILDIQVLEGGERTASFGSEQRRQSFSQRDGLVRIVDRHDGGESPHRSDTAGLDRSGSEVRPDGIQIVTGEQRAFTFGAQIL
jgi:hypothetical protein